MENISISITPSIVIEYMYCPRFIYFMKVLDIPQNEDARYKVQEGREVHKYKSLTNQEYLRKKLDVVKKESEQEVYAPILGIHGKIDEILFMSDATVSPLDYKFAEFKEKIFTTYKTQSIMYAMMLEEAYNIKSKKGYIVYTRSKNHIEEIIITDEDKKETLKIINDIYEIINKSYFPVQTKVKSRCDDCCYRNICIS